MLPQDRKSMCSLIWLKNTSKNLSDFHVFLLFKSYRLSHEISHFRKTERIWAFNSLFLRGKGSVDSTNHLEYLSLTFTYVAKTRSFRPSAPRKLLWASVLSRALQVLLSICVDYYCMVVALIQAIMRTWNGNQMFDKVTSYPLQLQLYFSLCSEPFPPNKHNSVAFPNKKAHV